MEQAVIKRAVMHFIKSALPSVAVWAVAAKPNQPAPYVVVTMEGIDRDRYYGPGGVATGVRYQDFEISAYGKTVEDASELARQLLALLENYAGPMSDGASPATVYNTGPIEVTSELEDYDHTAERYYYSIFVNVPH